METRHRLEKDDSSDVLRTARLFRIHRSYALIVPVEWVRAHWPDLLERERQDLKFPLEVELTQSPDELRIRPATRTRTGPE